MHVWTHDRWRFPLPEAHRFPISKYALLRERVLELGLSTSDEVHEAEPVGWEALGRVQDAALLERIRSGGLTLRESRALGLPWSPELVERGAPLDLRDAAGGARGAARRRGDELGRRDPPRRPRLRARLLPVQRRRARTRRAAARGRAAAARLVVDCDVHQGDGTAQVLGPDPDAFTLSLHGARNYPFQRIAVRPRRRPADRDRRRRLPARRSTTRSARRSPAARSDVAFFLAGADPWEGDRLGRLALHQTRSARHATRSCSTRLRGAGLPVCVVLAGGYAPDVCDTVDINAATAEAVAERTGSGGAG